MHYPTSDFQHGGETNCLGYSKARPLALHFEQPRFSVVNGVLVSLAKGSEASSPEASEGRGEEVQQQRAPRRRRSWVNSSIQGLHFPLLVGLIRRPLLVV